jgi:hypothetical protein
MVSPTQLFGSLGFATLRGMEVIRHHISLQIHLRLSELFLLQACHEQRSVEARVWKETFVVAPVSLDWPVFQRACSVDSYRI